MFISPQGSANYFSSLFKSVYWLKNNINKTVHIIAKTGLPSWAALNTLKMAKTWNAENKVLKTLFYTHRYAHMLS